MFTFRYRHSRTSGDRDLPSQSSHHQPASSNRSHRYSSERDLRSSSERELRASSERELRASSEREFSRSYSTRAGGKGREGPRHQGGDKSEAGGGSNASSKTGGPKKRVLIRSRSHDSIIECEREAEDEEGQGRFNLFF